MTTPTEKTVNSGPKERRFHDALRDLFVGVQVDGRSGYINLMRIKAAYFTKAVEPELMKDTAKALKDFPEFREELFDKLNAFFSRYFSRSGSICFAYTPQHMSVYEKIYSDEQDVVLFWKTHMLYYIKTDRLFKDLKMDVDGHTFFFDCTELEHKKSNEKRELVFALDKVEKDGVIRLTVAYSERGRLTKTEEILKALKKAEHPVTEAVLDKAMRVFGRQSEVDYFINKDARGFLREQYDLWMYQYVFKDETSWGEVRIRQLQSLKEIAFKIIDFIGQFEDELVRIWNKPKFVRNSYYVITLDRIAARPHGLDLIADMIKHDGMKAQVAEWRDLGIVEKDFDPKVIVEGRGSERKLINGWKSLPLDTRHFKNIETRLLALFDNLDDSIDGRLIKSENYQALNTLKEKFKGRVKCCYIDPPYNTGSDGFLYRDAFRHASWLSMIQDRISATVPLLGPKGVFYASIDDKERRHLEFACDEAFGRDNRIEEIIWVQNTTKNQSPTYSTNHEYVEVYARNKVAVSADARIFREPKPGYAEMMDLVEKLNPKYPTITEVQEAINELFEKHKIEFKEELDEQGVEYEKNLDLWKGLYGYSHAEYRDSEGHFVGEKDARKRKAKIWVWQEADASLPAGKQSPTTREPSDPNYRFYKPNHPVMGKPCQHPKTGWRWPLKTSDQQPERGSFESANNDDRIVWGENEKKVPREKRFLHEVDTQVAKSVVFDFTDGEKQLTELFGTSNTFPNPKPSTLISRFILQTTDEAEWIMDFTAGSGTTGHATADSFHTDRVRRKFILIDAADYFDTTLVPRIKKVFAASKWKAGAPVAMGGPGLFCKVCSLEQYEDAIKNAVYKEDDDLFLNTKTNPFSQYLFFRDEKMARALELDYKKDEVNIRLDRLYPDIDLAETLSCITGKWIKRITADDVEFADGSKQSLHKPDWRLLKPFIFWGPIV